MKRLLPQKETGDIFLFHSEEWEKDDKKRLLAPQGALVVMMHTRVPEAGNFFNFPTAHATLPQHSLKITKT